MAGEDEQITTEELAQQVTEYSKRFPSYGIFANALRRVLEKACKTAFPEAFVQARPKSITSFAEKCVRKYPKYKDPVNQLNDLCGARVIVQTSEQVKAVRAYIETHFAIVEKDDKGLILGDDKFGYRDMHYIVRLASPEKAIAQGFTPEEAQETGDKRAEIQVRTWVQHAWADTLHDRMYKTRLKYPAEFRRSGALLAAIMEDGDRSFNRLAIDIDGMLSNFNAYAPKEVVERELRIQELILSCSEEKKKPEIALCIANLVSARGDYDHVVKVLSPHAATPSPLGCAIRSELGYALCQVNRQKPDSDDYLLGQDYLRRVVDHCSVQAVETVSNERRRISTLARALARLAWAYEASDDDASKSRECYRKALQLEPQNPYYFADVVGHEISFSRRKDFVAAMASEVQKHIDICRQHIRNGTEMPYAAFTAGRLHLLLNESDLALGAYARGIGHVLEGTTFSPPGVLAAEQKWINLVTKPEPPTSGYLWAKQLLQLGNRLQGSAKHTTPSAKGIKAPVLIVAGGATSLRPGQVDVLRPMLQEAFTGFHGTIISGGTRVGVPGCVGEAADLVGPRNGRPFQLIGYLPRLRPADAPEDVRYDSCIECGENSFTAEQIIKNWEDILASGVKPADVRLLGFGGGKLSAAEYRIALGLGACVGLVVGSHGAADELLSDDLWSGINNLLALPCDKASVRALAHPAKAQFDEAILEKMAQEVHEEYVRNSTNRLPENMKPWGKKLKKTFQTANREQAKYSVQILEACGFEVRTVPPPAQVTVFRDFTEEEVEKMAEMEHGRWNIERLRDGWRYATTKDEAKKLHNCLVPWEHLPDGPDGVKRYDRDAVRKFPEILAAAGLEVRRKPGKR